MLISDSIIIFNAVSKNAYTKLKSRYLKLRLVRNFLL